MAPLLQDLVALWTLLSGLSPLAAVLLGIWIVRLERRLEAERKRMDALLLALQLQRAKENGDAA